MVLAWDADRPEPIAAYRPFEHLRTTRQSLARVGRAPPATTGRGGTTSLRSALALKLLMYRHGSHGGGAHHLAPEWIGRQRNWDYRYSWIRDAAMAIRATNLIGYRVEAREFFYFIRDTLDIRGALQVMYALDGGTGAGGADAHAPRRRPGLPAGADRERRAGPAPVRHGGRAARRGVPLRALRGPAAAAHLAASPVGLQTPPHHWREPDHGIWEPRPEMRHNVHSKLMCWLALHRGQRLARLFGEPDFERAWRHRRTSSGVTSSSTGWTPAVGTSSGSYGGDEPDAALLLMPDHRVLHARDPLVQRTIDWLRAELGDGPVPLPLPDG